MIVFFLSFFMFVFSVHGSEELPLRLGVPLARPPYNFGNGEGIEMDLIRYILKETGYKIVSVEQMPHVRLITSLKEKKVDLVAPLKGQFQDVFGTEHFMLFRNCIVTRNDFRQIIKEEKDLDKRSVALFSIADKVLGPKMAELSVENKSRWLFTTDQKRQVELLLKQRVDALVLDISIFKWYTQQEGLSDATVNKSYSIPFCWPKTEYSILSLDESLVKKINRFIATGTYKNMQYQIYKKHTNKQFADLLLKK